MGVIKDGQTLLRERGWQECLVDLTPEEKQHDQGWKIGHGLCKPTHTSPGSLQGAHWWIHQCKHMGWAGYLETKRQYSGTVKQHTVGATASALPKQGFQLEGQRTKPLFQCGWGEPAHQYSYPRYHFGKSLAGIKQQGQQMDLRVYLPPINLK